MSDVDLDGYQERICHIRDAEHQEKVGTDDDPAYSQSVRLMLEDDETGMVFMVVLSEEDVRQIANLDHALSSKEMIKYAEVLRRWEHPVKMMAPRKSSEVSTDVLMNTRPESQPSPIEGKADRSAAVKRFGFPLKKS